MGVVGKALPAAAGLLGVVVGRRYRRAIRSARARLAGASRRVETAGFSIQFAESGGGPALLVVHGAGGGFDQGLAIGRPLVRAGFRVIAPSRFGYLGTPAPADHSPQAQAEAHISLLRALGVEEVSVLGISAGAPSAMALCLRYPQLCSRLVLLSPLAYRPLAPEAPPPGPSRLDFVMLKTIGHSDFLFWVLVRAARTTATRVILAVPPEDFRRAPPGEKARVSEVLEQMLPITERIEGFERDAKMAAAVGRLPLERIATPTLVVAARDDLFGYYESARYTAEAMPNAELVTLERGGHLWVGQQETIWPKVIAFLGRDAV